MLKKYPINKGPPCHLKPSNASNAATAVSTSANAFRTSASDEEIALWEMEGRYDILEWVNSIHLGEEYYIHDIWTSPKTGDDVGRCP